MSTRNKSIETIAEQIFKNILKSEKNVVSIVNFHEEDKDYNSQNKPMKNSFIDPITVNYIHYHTSYMKVICFEYKGVIIQTKIYTKLFEDLSNYVHLIKIAIVSCLQDKHEYKEKIHLKIEIYLTDLKKVLPSIPGSNVKKEHTKSGYSYFNDSMYICIYRREEWFKSLISELFYAFTIELDADKISYRNVLSNNFHIDDDFFITNSVIEFCARLFNMSLFLYYEKNVKHLGIFKNEFTKMLLKERNFAIVQTIKIMKHFNLRYNDLLKKENKTLLRDKFRDESELFCYFIITSILFIHYHRIIQWINFEQNNFFNIKKSERDLVIFTHYIAFCSNDPRTINSFVKKEGVIESAETSTYESTKKNQYIKYCYHRI